LAVGRQRGIDVTAIGVLCARVRVEEKQVIAALANAGVVALPVPPASAPMPPGPATADLAALGTHQPADASAHHALEIVIDRCQNRHVAAAMLPLLKLGGARVIDAGLAATGTRLEVASALVTAGVPRPQAFIAMSEAAALDAAARLGYPATLLPQQAGTAATALLDHDTAEAVIEHRVVLGTHGEAIMLLQAGAPNGDRLGRHHVVGDAVVATEGALVDGRARALAIAAAAALGAQAITVDVAEVDGRLVVWDVVAVTDFRAAMPTGERTVGQALAELAASKAPVAATSRIEDVPVAVAHQGWEVQVRDGVVGVSLSA
jgi:glutathione synthase/RimK-type ligase-like ATP-grasp enzyme